MAIPAAEAMASELLIWNDNMSGKPGLMLWSTLTCTNKELKSGTAYCT